MASTTQPTIRVLVLDDDTQLLKVIGKVLKQAGFDPLEISDPIEGLMAARQGELDVILSDVQMPNLSGMDLLKELKRTQTDVEVLLMTGDGSISAAVEALKAGAYDYLTKPVDHARLVRVIANAAERKRMRSRAAALEAMLNVKQHFEDLVGQSRKMAEVFRLVDSVAPSSATVLIQGESGTGKELIARALHRRSPRKNQAFVPVNCSALTESLLESELFGHVKGSFTGAIANKRGLFQAANNGTLFLDEIGEMPMGTQAKLLRVLQDGMVRPVGSTENVSVDVRLVAATNVPLAQAKTNGKFREDLFYRLNVITIQLPPLRDRPEDIATLALHFLQREVPESGKKITAFNREAMDRLMAHAWTGNVRELENVIKRAVVLAQGTEISAEDLPDDVGKATRGGDLDPASLSHLPFYQARELNQAAFERRYAASMLRKTQGNVTRAAELAGVDRSNFSRLLRQHGIAARNETGDDAT